MRCVAPKESEAKRIPINPYAQPRAHRGMFGKRVNLKEWMQCMFLFLFVFLSFYACGLQWMVSFLEICIHTFCVLKKFHNSILQREKRRILKTMIRLTMRFLTKC